MNKSLFKILSLVSVLFCSISAPSFADDIDDFIQIEMKKRKIPGLQLAVIQNNKIIKSTSYGLANIQDAVPVDNDTLMSINSITKAFTGVAIMQLVEQGKLDLSKDIGSYLPNLPPAWRALKIPQLMSHTSGLPGILSNSIGGLISDKGADASWQLVQTLPNEFAADSRFKYNQTGYIVIGKIIEQITNQPFTDFITENQLQKIAMKRTEEAGFENLNNVVAHSARRYKYDYNQDLTNLEKQEFSPMLYPAVGMSSTATEMAKWIIALQSKAFLQKQSSLTTLWEPAILDSGHTQAFNSVQNGYALGWPIAVRDKHPAVAPSGGNRSAFFIYPQDDLAIVVLTNLADAVPEYFIDDIAGFYIPEMKKENGFGLSPSVKALWLELEKEGYYKTTSIANSLQQTKSIKFVENEINSFGYWLIAQDKIQQALNVFMLNTQLFPESSNTFDSLAETHWRLNNIQQAINGYEKTLQLEPQNEYVKAQLAKLEKVSNK